MIPLSGENSSLVPGCGAETAPPSIPKLSQVTVTDTRFACVIDQECLADQWNRIIISHFKRGYGQFQAIPLTQLSHDWLGWLGIKSVNTSPSEKGPTCH